MAPSPGFTQQNCHGIYSRKIVLKSDAKYCHLNAAGLLLVFICTLGYTKDSLTDSIANQRVEFKEQYLKFPLFCKIDGTAIMVVFFLEWTLNCDHVLAWRASSRRFTPLELGFPQDRHPKKPSLESLRTSCKLKFYLLRLTSHRLNTFLLSFLSLIGNLEGTLMIL